MKNFSSETDEIWKNLIQALYRTSKTEAPIEHAMAYIGETMGFSCVAFYEVSIQEKSSDLTIQWQKAGQGETIDLPDKLFELAQNKEKGYCKEILEVSLFDKGLYASLAKQSEELVVIHYPIVEAGQVIGNLLYIAKQEAKNAFGEEKAEFVIQLSAFLGEKISKEMIKNRLLVQSEFLQTLYGMVQNALVQLELQGDRIQVLYANDATFKIFGCSREIYKEVFCNSAERFIYVEDFTKVLNILKNISFEDEITQYEHRYINYIGELRWLQVNASRIINEEGREVIQVIFWDITKSKQLQLDLEHEKERYRIALDSSSDVIFEYDLIEDEYVSYGSFGENLVPKTTPITIYDFKNKVLSGKQCHSEDISTYYEFITGYHKEPFEAREVYEENGETKYLWVATEGTPIYDNGNLVKIIGKKRNIHERKEKELKALEVFQRDKLTKLYTRAVGEKLITQYLKEKPEEEIASLLLIDLDNFQRINDTYSYMFGDAILKEVAEVIKATTRQHDIIARYGGDEFLILMKNTEKDKTMVYGKRLYEKICNLYSGEKENVTISCSIGMVCTQISKDYQTLFQCADQGLAYVKNNGRGDAVCYCGLEKPEGELPSKQYIENNTDKEIEEMYSEQDNEDIISFAFAILEKTKDLRSAINVLLSRVGRQLGMNKISVLESDYNFLCNIITYEWVLKKEYHDSICKYRVSQEEFELWTSKFGPDGLFVMTEELKEQFTDGINVGSDQVRNKNQLYSAIVEEGEFRGAIVFEHADENFIWNSEMKATIKEISKIISTHITKANADIASKAKTEFLSRMSHEIRTPMNAIVGMTSIAKSVIGDDEKTADCLEKIDTSTKYLLSLINDILDMSRIESGNMTVCADGFNLEKLIEELFVLMLPQAEVKGIHLSLEKAYTDIRLIGDELRLTQVLINIIGNALKFTPSKGTITVRVEQLVQEEDVAKIRFSVRDTGIGIEESNLIKIFNSFEQAEDNTARKFGGTGLGLAISSNLVKLMGGKLEVKSEEGKGSEFYFTITFALDSGTEEPIKEKTECRKEREAYNFKGKRLLVVEDNELNAEIAQTILEMAEFKTELAQDGQEAVDMFEENPAYYYDAILMDIRMPIMGGLEATRCIRVLGKEDSRSIPIIAMTANAFDEDTKKSIESGMNGHLSKPIDVNKLYDALEEIMNSKQ